MEERNLDNLLPSPEEAQDLRQAVLRGQFPAPSVDEQWQAVSAQLGLTARRRARRVALWSVVAAAAACLLGLLVVRHGAWSPEDAAQSPRQEVFTANNDTARDVTIATDGGKRRVVRQPVVSFAGGGDTAAQAQPLIAMSTPRGKECNLTLPDGTRVWMNADSQLEFPKQFTGKTREVRLRGEAYFEVTPDRQHPFVVSCDYFTTTVVGTTFNMRAYSERDASVVLIEGRVNVKDVRGQFAHALRPGQQAQVNQRRMLITPVDTYPYTQRKAGYFYYNHESLLHIMTELGRWYNKTIVFENSDHMDTQLHFVAERRQSLTSVINSLNELDGVDIVLGKDEITVK